MAADAVGKTLVVAEHLENFFRSGLANLGVLLVPVRSRPPGEEQKMMGVNEALARWEKSWTPWG